MPEDRAQRTEEPTPRRRHKAREEGQVASSRELTAAVQFTFVVGLLALFGDDVIAALERASRGIVVEAFRATLSLERLRGMAAATTVETLRFFWTVGAGLVGISLLMHLIQTGFALTPKRLTPDFGRLNPGPRIRELPAQNLTQFGKALLLLPLAAWAFWYVVQSRLNTFLLLPRMSLAAGAVTVGRALTELLLEAAVVLLLLGAWDFYHQRRRLLAKLRMTKQEVRQEHKDLEGNPEVKGRLRRLRREMMRRRMMSAVPSASVVVTNPSHYAVALKYEPASMAAPLVVAKGVDYLALRIRQVAEQHRVPIVENPPLAQALYKSSEVGDEIPANLYRAVAEILAYIFRLSGKMP